MCASFRVDSMFFSKTIMLNNQFAYHQPMCQYRSGMCGSGYNCDEVFLFSHNSMERYILFKLLVFQFHFLKAAVSRAEWKHSDFN